jgi:hypothetical protein
MSHAKPRRKRRYKKIAAQNLFKKTRDETIVVRKESLMDEDT